MFSEAMKYFFDSVQSTNTTAQELISSNEPAEGTAIVAHEQLAGKGYSTNSWESEPGSNLLVSFILRPDFLEPYKQFELTKIFSLAVCDTIKHFIPSQKERVTIKWPNDIYVDEKKISGILTENAIMANTIKYCICGIGINVNQLRFISDAPNPVSLRQITDIVYPLPDILDSLCEQLDKWYGLLKASEHNLINIHYHENLFKIGVMTCFQTRDGKFMGTIIKTDELGKLIIEDIQKKIQIFDFKEVSYVFDR